MSDLCQYCRCISFKPDTLRDVVPSSGTLTLTLGTVAWVRSNTGCPFCRIIRRVIIAEKKTAVYQMPLSDDYRFKVFHTIGKSPGRRTALQLCCFLRPRLSGDVEIHRVKAWVDHCTDTHSSCIRRSSDSNLESFPGLDVLRLIDVEDNCLVEAINKPRYVSLSYVWGSVSNFRLTKANRWRLMRLGSIINIWDDLPRTIKDAIVFVRLLGLRYLWVDSLCLLQNDPEDLAKGINVMDQIYEMAWLTIVAACGHDANAGLPGVQKDSREAETVSLTEVQPGIQLGIYPDLDRLLGTTAYATRAWTFQEHLLSRRIVYFIADKVFFRCQESECSELWVDDPEPGRYEGAFGPVLPSRLTMEMPIRNYSTVLTSYTRRALTNQNDALSAMSGIIRRFSVAMRSRIFEGLPCCALDAFVLFEGTRLRRRNGFPSYSWTGWIGEVRCRVPDYLSDWLKDHTWIVWYHRSACGIINPVWDPEQNDFSTDDPKFEGYRDRSPFHCPELSLSTTRTVPTEVLGTTLPIPPSYPILQFWTLACFYRIGDIDVFRGWTELIGSRGDPCGNVHLDDFEQTNFEQNQCFEFILLSEEPRRYYTGRGVYKVMLLKWQDGVAERRGIGIVFKDKFQESYSPGPVWKEILLA
ncbi:HET-domain-containing protein [Echria macrotheca]|uniref:HET-domain-containing protein n=1 Tax=Echria macrotheca TaxID=438768 RepID=A0AAJ0F4V3_9PEZI|nr:HET-domain-containing protein [Echria macrotheca]